MEVIQIGSLAILSKWVILGIAVLFGLIFIKIWLRRSQQVEQSKQVFDVVVNSLFIGFFVWKGSLLLINPLLVMKSPYSLLYFTGGSNGLLIAIICSSLYFIYKVRKVNVTDVLMFQSIFLFSFAVLSVYYIVSAFFLDRNIIYHFILGSFTMVILIGSLWKKRLLLQKNVITYSILFSFLNLIVSFIFLQTDNRLFIFSMEQWFFIGLIILLLFIDREGKNTNT